MKLTVWCIFNDSRIDRIDIDLCQDDGRKTGRPKWITCSYCMFVWIWKDFWTVSSASCSPPVHTAGQLDDPGADGNSQETNKIIQRLILNLEDYVPIWTWITWHSYVISCSLHPQLWLDYGGCFQFFSRVPFQKRCHWGPDLEGIGGVDQRWAEL